MRIRIFATAIAAAVLLSGCTVRTADTGTELTQEEKEI